MLAGARKAFNRKDREENPRRSQRKASTFFFATFAVKSFSLRSPRLSPRPLRFKIFCWILHSRGPSHFLIDPIKISCFPSNAQRLRVESVISGDCRDLSRRTLPARRSA
jgi:hypothetical protein